MVPNTRKAPTQPGGITRSAYSAEPSGRAAPERRTARQGRPSGRAPGTAIGGYRACRPEPAGRPQNAERPARETPPCGPSGGTIRVRPRFAAVSRRAGPRAQEALRRHPGRCGKDPSTMPGACAAKAQSPLRGSGTRDAERPARDGHPAVPARPTMPGGGRMRRNADRPGREAAASPKRGEARRGNLPLRASLGAIEKRPPRARRPALPQPRAAVLSAKAGLTAGFGMGPGDPRLCGRARGGRSPAALSMEPARNPCPGRPWRPHGGHGRRSRIALGASHRGCEELGLLVPLG